MCAPDFPCEQVICVGGRIGWRECGRRPARLVAFPKTPPMTLCEEHERQASDVRARASLPIGGAR